MKQSTILQQYFYSLAGIAVIVLLPHSGIFPNFTYAIPVLLTVWLLLKLSGEKISGLGFSFKGLNLRAVFTGLAAAILFFLFMDYVFFPVLKMIIHIPPADLSDFQFIRNNPFNFIFILLMGWLIGGFYEELVFHGFIFTRLERIFTGRQAIVISFLITNIIFALYHWQLGAQGVINAFMAGCAYQALALKHKRNLWYAFFFHGFFDTIALTFIYLGYM